MDQTILHLINEQWTSPVLDLFMAVISHSGIWWPLLAIILLCGLIFGGFKARACILCLLVALTLGEQLTGLLKKTVDRRRPKQAQTVRMVELQKARPTFMTIFKKPTIRYSDRADRKKSGASFPSGHMMNNTIIATICALFYRRWGWLYSIVALAVGYSRVYLGAHWPSDVVATIFLGVGEALLVVLLLEFVWRWAGRKWAPQIYARHPRLLGNVGQVSNLPSTNSRVENSRHS